VLVVHPGHDFAASGQIRMAQMATEHLILFDRVSSYHELTSSIFRQAGIEPRGYLEVDNIDAAKRIGRAAARDRAATPHLCAAGDRWRASLSRDRLGHARRATPDRGRSTARYRGASGVVAAFLQTLDELVQGVTDQVGSSPDIGLPSALPKQDNVGR